MVIKSRILKMCLGLLLVSLVVPCTGAEPAAPDAKAVEAAGKVTTALDAILTQANESKVPAVKEISAGQALVESSKRYFPKMDDKQKAQYCLLQSWLAYYAGQLDNAHANALKAWKLDENGDTLATQVAMALAAGKKPMLPRPPKQAKQPRNRNGGGMEGMEGMMGQPQGMDLQIQPGKLSFDVKQFLAMAIDTKLEPMELVCLNGTTFSFKPGEAAVCVLFWQQFEAKKPALSNEPNQRGSAAPEAMPTASPMMGYEGMMGEMMMGMGQSDASTPTGAFGKLFRTGLAGGGKMKFLAVNLDSAEHKQAVVDTIFKQPQVWAQVLLADQSLASLPEYGGVSPNKPILVMADAAGTVRYAGSATGFIPPLLLDVFSGTKLEQPAEVKAVVDSNSLLPADSNSLAKPAPAAVPAAKPAIKAARPEPQPRALSEEDAIMAERKLQVTKDLFMEIGKKPGLNYTRGVKFCREIIKEYPGSEYANGARQLLREIPEKERGRYNITDEELGL